VLQSLVTTQTLILEEIKMSSMLWNMNLRKN
jgi:hypothetical protein